MSNWVTNPDVVIIGAGTAGLSAAKALRQAGLEPLVLEAAGHIGGRCVTDTTNFSVPFDRGGSWLHSAEINPLAPLAERHGFSLHKKPWRWEDVFAEGQLLSKAEVSQYSDYMDAMWDVIVETGKTDRMSTISEVLPAGRYRDTAKLFIAQMLGGDFDVTTPSDMANYADSEGDWLVEGGLGSFIRHLHRDIDVVLECPISKIDYSGSRIKITTPNGQIETSRIVLTVSVGVLSAETIEFYPPLPNSKIRAIEGLPNGLLNKVGLEFDPDWKAAHEGYMLDYHRGDEDYCTVLFGFYGSTLATGFTAGRFAATLEQEGPGAATTFCLEALRNTFGNDIEKHITKSVETHWLTNPLTFGSYSYLLPGHDGAREALAATINDSIFFAGEATMPSAFATVHGAYMSGKACADRLVSTQRRL